MRLPDVIGVLGALVVGGLLTVLLLASAVGAPPAFVTPSPPTMPPVPTLVAVATPSAGPTTVVGSPSGSGSPTVGVGIGQTAPTIEVTLTDGSRFSTADYAGIPLWVNFMATWCPECVTELPMMQTYQAQLNGQMTILVVDVGEDSQTVKSFIKSLNVDLPVGVDSDSSIQKQWGAFALPIHYWTDSTGVIQQIVYGGAPPEVFDQAVGAVLPAPSASPAPSL